MKAIEVDIEVVGPIMIPLEVHPEINIDLDFNLTEKELLYMESLVGDKKEQRKQEIIRLYFVQKHTLEETGALLGASKSAIGRLVEEIRAETLGVIKKDLRANKKLLGHMVGLMNQIDSQTAIIWDKITELEKYAEQLRHILQEADRQASLGILLTETAQINKAFNNLLSIHDRQQKYFNMLRQQTMAMLFIFDTFGLTGKDALEVILKGGVDVDKSIQEVKESIVSLIRIIKEEVQDSRVRKNIFGRLANDIKIRALDKQQEDLNN